MSYDKWSLLCTGPFTADVFLNGPIVIISAMMKNLPLALLDNSLIYSHQTTCYCCPFLAEMVTLLQVNVHHLSNQSSFPSPSSTDPLLQLHFTLDFHIKRRTPSSQPGQNNNTLVVLLYFIVNVYPECISGSEKSKQNLAHN